MTYRNNAINNTRLSICSYFLVFRSYSQSKLFITFSFIQLSQKFIVISYEFFLTWVDFLLISSMISTFVCLSWAWFSLPYNVFVNFFNWGYDVCSRHSKHEQIETFMLPIWLTCIQKRSLAILNIWMCKGVLWRS